MKLITTFTEAPLQKKWGVVIGNFDGMHLGHRSILSAIKNDCVDLDLNFCVITFVPHPGQVLNRQNNFLINSYEERDEFFSEMGVDYLMKLDFSERFSKTTPSEFLDEFIFASKKIGKIYVGHDMTFGANKSGDFMLLEKYCSDKGVACAVQDEFLQGENIISSSIIREQIKRRNPFQASRLLGRPFFISGKVIRGVGRGHLLGFPTANIEYGKERIIPGKAVYLTKVQIEDQLYNSVTNVGSNPTFGGERDITVETHILDFDRDIYGSLVRVIFLDKIRDEKRFTSQEMLIEQIHLDIAQAKEKFRRD